MKLPHLLAVAGCLLILAFCPANAQTVYTWNGGGTDGSWTDANNWGGTAPTGLSGANEALYFGGTGQVTTVDTNNPWYATSLNFNANTGNFTIGGNPITLSGSTAINANVAGTFTQNITSNIVLTNAGTTTIKSGTSSTGNLNLSGNITGVNGQLVVFRGSGNNSIFTGNLKGTSSSVNAIKTDNGTWIFSGTGSNIYSFYISNGTLKLGATNALTSGVNLIFGNAATATQVVDLAGYNQKIGGLTVTGDKAGNVDRVTNSAATTSILTYSRNTAETYSGQITGKITFVKQGTATFALTGTGNTYSDGTLVSAGTLVVDGDSVGTGDITVQSGAAVALNPTAALSNTIDVQAGALLTLSVSTALSSAANIIMESETTSVLNLGFDGTDTIGSLMLNGSYIPTGTYTLALLQSTYGVDSFIGNANASLIVTVPEPTSGGLLLFVGLISLFYLPRLRTTGQT